MKQRFGYFGNKMTYFQMIFIYLQLKINCFKKYMNFITPVEIFTKTQQLLVAKVKVISYQLFTLLFQVDGWVGGGWVVR